VVWECWNTGGWRNGAILMSTKNIKTILLSSYLRSLV